MASLTARGLAIRCAGVGVAAGVMGTWFEMSHGVVCIPVLTLPPLYLSHQVAAGSTVFGVAARQVISATLYSLDPNTDVSDIESLHAMMDVNAAGVLAASGTAAALSTAVITSKLSLNAVLRCNGGFLVALALFLQWREKRIEAAQIEEEKTQMALQELDATTAGGASSSSSSSSSPGTSAAPAAASASAAAAAADAAAAAAAAAAAPAAAPAAVSTPSTADPAALASALSSNLPSTSSQVSNSDLPRLIGLGAMSGAILGVFGVGPAWMLAPLLVRTAQPGQLGSEGKKGSGDLPDILGAFGSDERTRMTACMAMVPPSLAAAWRHWQLGNVQNMSIVAFPLGAGAILGSALGGQLLADVPCDSELRTVLSWLLAVNGLWLCARPFVMGS
mmetsp:Transcript_92487/g.193365  ORF Transcript_92487/g.193365 Transcript_92487/m.193365 type:complete len:391 (-) Transcript_92487:40-1212(-)